MPLEKLDPAADGYKVSLGEKFKIPLSYNVYLQFDGTVYTFGFGSDHDSNLLEAISTQGGGVYYFIDSNDKVLVHA